jgi:hypothetical protein
MPFLFCLLFITNPVMTVIIDLRNYPRNIGPPVIASAFIQKKTTFLKALRKN